jgi:hypothetical protein
LQSHPDTRLMTVRSKPRAVQLRESEERTMRELRVGLLGGLVALMGLAGAASANSVSLVWQGSGTSTTSSVLTSSNVVLDIVLIDSGNGLIGGGMTVDYGSGGKVTVVSVTCNPDLAFELILSAELFPACHDTGTQVRNINGLNPFGPVSGNARLGSIVFHKEAVSGNVNLQGLYTATDALDGGTGSASIPPELLGTATLINVPGHTATPTPPTPTPAPFCGDGTVDPGEECEDNSDCPPHTPICIPGLCRCDPDLVTPPPTPTSLTPTPPTPTIPPTCAQLNPSVTINTIGKGQSPTVNALIRHEITGNIINPGALSATAHRIPVCAGSTVTAVVVDIVGASTNTANGSLFCDSGGCSGVVDVKERYTSIATRSGDKDSITFLPQ